MENLSKILRGHLLYLFRPNSKWAKKAELVGAHLEGVNLAGVNLRKANLQGAYCVEANLQGANLQGADLRAANLTDANLRDANLRDASLRGTNLRGADLRGADLDLAAWPLSCGSFTIGQTDDRLTAQLVRHAREVAAANSSSDYGRRVWEVLAEVDRFHLYRDDVDQMDPVL